MAKLEKIKKLDKKFAVLPHGSFFAHLLKAVLLKERLFTKPNHGGWTEEFRLVAKALETRLRSVFVAFLAFGTRCGAYFDHFILIFRRSFPMGFKGVFPGFLTSASLPYLGRCLKFTLVILVCFVLLLNFLAFLYPSLDSKDFVSREPENISYRIKLIDDMISMNDLRDAKREAGFLAGFYPGNVYAQKKMNQVNMLEGRPREVMSQIVFWEREVRSKPNYRDGYLRLAVLFWQVYKDNEARNYLKRALEIDPNYPPSRELERVMGW